LPARRFPPPWSVEEQSACFARSIAGAEPPHWIKVKNPNAPAVKREAEEDCGK
jgi:hypothetical protein